ncbi:MAG TPA: AAA family ATPase [Bacillota bacterium]|nr:AAA family ATPase [Bacillota bacterium]
MISRFESIKNHRVFQNFRWTSDLGSFSKYNLIYGGNATGKTTLANLFRVLEKREEIHEGEFTVSIAGRSISSKDLTSEPLPPIRVFNEGFINENVFTLSGSVSPIFVIGEKSIEAQKQAEELKKQLRDKLEEQVRLKKDVEIREDSLEEFCTDAGRKIKLLLSSSGKNPYNSYTRRNFIKTAEELAANGTYSSFLLDESEKERLMKIIAGTPKDRVSPLRFKLPDLGFFTEQTARILGKSVLAQFIFELKNDPALAEWVQEGMEQHKKKNSSACLFCGQPLPPERLRRLEAHFNHQYTDFIVEIDKLMELIQHQIDELDNVKLPDKAALNDHLVQAYIDAIKELDSEIERTKAVLRELLSDLNEKKGRVFEKYQPRPIGYSPHSDPIAKINEIILRHNQETGDFQSVVNEARSKLEKAMVAESMESYLVRKRNLAAAKEKLNECESAIRDLRCRIDEIEIAVTSHRRPAEELNLDLQQFLGHDFLRLEAMDSGYRIMRNDEVATDLSQGERAAIAFLYFLKTLDDKDFDRNRGIVVIDDPVVGLDEKSMSYAFNFLKDRVADVAQLFILTHSQQFSRQIQTWFKESMKISASVSCYKLDCATTNSGRSSKLVVLDEY